VRASLEVADIFRSAGPAYRTAHAGHLSLHQLKVMSAIEHCRTAVMGGHVEACTDCGHMRVAYNSCRNCDTNVAPGLFCGLGSVRSVGHEWSAFATRREAGCNRHGSLAFGSFDPEHEAAARQWCLR
jgi:hypothetical protein